MESSSSVTTRDVWWGGLLCLVVLVSCGFGVMTFRHHQTSCACLPMNHCRCVPAKPCECGDAVRRLEQRLDRIGRETRTGTVQLLEFPTLEKP